MLSWKSWIKLRRNVKDQGSQELVETNRTELAPKSGPSLGNLRQHLQQPFSVFALTLVIAATINACSYKSPSVEEIAPVDNADIPKSFFVTTEVDAKTKQTINVPKKFMCGWASEMEVGRASEYAYTNNAISTEHCNLVFEITEHKLIGKLINPSFANDPSRWEIVLTIPISSHHYVERDKDGAGRETNKEIRNSGRSHWSARPYMNLELAGINLEGKFQSQESWWGMRNLGNINVDKVEWDMKNGFLGFTLQKGTAGGSYAAVRFNIKEFQTNPNFKKTPFNDQNYRKMNVLHVIGEKVKGIYPILHAAHWDVTKKIEIRLWEVPEKYKDLVKEIVGEWNDVLRKADATTLSEGPFVVSETPAKHAFDLRYPTIAWVADEKISTYSPLGIGMALADVSNGEIKWGMITLYGGYIEKYMKSYLDTSSSLGSKAGKFAKSLLAFTKIPAFKDAPPEFDKLSLSLPAQDSTIAKFMRFFDSKENQDLAASNKEAAKAIMNSQAQAAKELLGMTKNQALTVARNAIATTKQVTSDKGLEKVLKSEFLGKFSKAETFSASENPFVTMANQQKTFDAAGLQNEIREKYQGNVFDMDRTFADMIPVWSKELGKTADSAGGGIENDEKTLRHLVKELITHEYGHFLGLGHQFKENILPAKGSVPEDIYSALAEKATAQNNYTNYTSVMGYRNPRVELKEAGPIKPGPHDELVIRFLYRQQYSTFKAGDKEFTFVDVPQDGIIPETNPAKPEYKTTYFEQCNDIQASLAMDPYCNRFDSGATATDIVRTYFSDLNANLIPSLYAFTDARGGNSEEAEGHLWMKSLTTLSRVRVFYDYMRLYFKPQFDLIRNDERALMQFSAACQMRTEDIQHPTLKKIFSESPQLKDLCAANALALAEIKALVSLKVSDFTKMNVKSQFIPGGMDGGDASRDWSRFLGSWVELSGLPLKYSSLMALTTATPWIVFGENMWPHFMYSGPEAGFSYMYLYPNEYTKIMAANARYNLKFASLGQSDRTTMGRSVLAMGWMNYIGQSESNDKALFPSEYGDRIRKQQEFNLGMVAIILKGVKRENGSPNKAVRWDGEIYDMAVDKPIPISSAYILPGGSVIASAAGMFLYPITKFVPFSDFGGYVLAYKLNYDQEDTDEMSLSDIGVKKDLKDIHDDLMQACVIGTDGKNNGLSSYFSTDNLDFQGFTMGTTLERSLDKKKEFMTSIDKAFADYYSAKRYGANAPKPETCQESLRGIGLLISSAAVLNGYWLPEVMGYVQK